MSTGVCSQMWLSEEKRDLLERGLSLKLTAAAIFIGLSAFTVFGGGLLLALVAVDRDSNGIDVPGIDVATMRLSGYVMLGIGAAVLVLASVAWLVLARVAHCEIRDQEHLHARHRYQFPGEDGAEKKPQPQQQQRPSVHNAGDIAMEIFDRQLHQQRADVKRSRERLVM